MGLPSIKGDNRILASQSQIAALNREKQGGHNFFQGQQDPYLKFLYQKKAYKSMRDF